MQKLPVISGKQLLKVLKRHDYKVIRQKGSHVFIESPEDGKGTVIPIHGNEDLGRGLLKSILNDLGLSVEALMEKIK